MEGAECPKCGEEMHHIVFRCGKVRRVRDEGKARLGKGKRNEMGQLGCVGIKEVGENGGIGPCR